MARRIDPDTRREQISDAVIDEIDAQGIRSVTFARIAARTGLAIGSIRHYFNGSLREVMRFTLEVLIQRAQRRGPGLCDDPAQRIVDAIVLTAPTSEQERKENVALVEYRVMARTDPELASPIADSSASATDAVHALLREALTGRVIDEAALRDEARLLISLIEGLSFGAALSSVPLDEAEVRAAVSASVRRLLEDYPPSDSTSENVSGL